MTDTAPHWLDAEEKATWRALTGVLIRLPAALDSQLRRDAGISHFEYQVLAVLTDAGREKAEATAPGHVAEVRRLVFTP
ncbi:hypothetical protein ABZX85_27595 [Streptomyces sp. NPDC004539]|uniref:hypothetical protein n=1 Tax=Streptomyces sp. NPDC004539 TaxID=3154280 RepID=UPI0033B0A781